jgi:hypothetical protein
VPTGVAGISPHGQLVIVDDGGVAAQINERRMLMIVGGRTVVMFRMIVAQVLVYVHRRTHGA